MQQSLHHQLLDKVRTYHIPQRAVELLNKHQPLILTGPTASGQSAVMHRIEETSDWRHVITYTTRPPREGEVSGQSYFFVSEAEMLHLLETEEVIEANSPHSQAVYGVGIGAYESVVRTGYKPLLVIDVQGIQDILKGGADIQPYFLLPPNFDVWMERLDRRGAMSHVEKQHRLRSARTQLEIAIRDAHFTLLMNQEVTKTAQEILAGRTDPPTQHRYRALAEELIDHISSY